MWQPLDHVHTDVYNGDDTHAHTCSPKGLHPSAGQSSPQVAHVACSRVQPTLRHLSRNPWSQLWLNQDANAAAYQGQTGVETVTGMKQITASAAEPIYMSKEITITAQLHFIPTTLHYTWDDATHNVAVNMSDWNTCNIHFQPRKCHVASPILTITTE